MAGKLKIPRNLKHKPIVYWDIQNEKEEISTDAKFISLGYASWNHDDFSVKIFRKPNKRWSRQSEEIPPQRLLNLSLFLISKIFEEELCFENEGVLENTDALNNYLAQFRDSTSIKQIFKILAKHIKEIKDL